MSAEQAIIVWLALVLVSAVVVSYLAHRWGRDPFGWILLSAAMGPIAIVALVGTHQSDRARTSPGAASEGGGTPIVIACDGSDVGPRLAEQTAPSYRTGREVVLLAVLPHDAREHGDSAETSARVNAMVLEVKRSLDGYGVPSRTVVRYGPPGEAIVQFADELSASLIVVGRRGSGLTRSLLGSVSGHVAEHARAPVLVVS
jgi:nucleotide-binding universal stress UspA family protein